MRRSLLVTVIFVALMGAAGSACSAGSAALEATPGVTSAELVPYHTLTPGSTPTPLPGATSTPAPPPSATPLTHTVQQGEEMFGIALRYGVTLNALRAANPGVDPDMLYVGTVLIIPSPVAGTGASTGLPDQVVLDLPLTAVRCLQDASEGAWCFLSVNNFTDGPAQGIAVQVDLLDDQGNAVLTQTAAAPLDMLPSRASMPVAVYFPPPLPVPLKPTARLLSAYPVSGDEGYYLELRVENMRQQVRTGGLAVDISGDLVLDGTEGAALLWVLAAAYDRDGEVVGLRRWESTSGFAPGQSMPFIMHVYSIGVEIVRVDIITEAHRQ